MPGLVAELRVSVCVSVCVCVCLCVYACTFVWGVASTQQNDIPPFVCSHSTACSIHSAWVLLLLGNQGLLRSRRMDGGREDAGGALESVGLSLLSTGQQKIRKWSTAMAINCEKALSDMTCFSFSPRPHPLQHGERTRLDHSWTVESAVFTLLMPIQYAFLYLIIPWAQRVVSVNVLCDVRHNKEKTPMKGCVHEVQCMFTVIFKCHSVNQKTKLFPVSQPTLLLFQLANIKLTFYSDNAGPSYVAPILP